jgi:hypothetical protein
MAISKSKNHEPRLLLQILGQILVALSFASSYYELGDCAECIRFAKKSINDIVAECNYLIKSTPGKYCNREVRIGPACTAYWVMCIIIASVLAVNLLERITEQEV